MRRTVDFWIYKNFVDGPEAWDGPFKTFAVAKRMYDKNYKDNEDPSRRAPDFVIAKCETTPLYPLPVKKGKKR